MIAGRCLHQQGAIAEAMTLIVTVALATACGSSLCQNSIVQELPSPDNRHVVVVFIRDCGATTDFSTQVSVLDYGQTIDNSATGNVFIADSDHGLADETDSRTIAMTVSWRSPSTLAILHDSRARVFHAVSEVDDVQVEYK